MTLISQTLSTIVTPGLREAMLFGGERADWTRILDECGSFRHDDAVLRVLDSEARREEHRRQQERKLIWCAPAPACASVARPHIFRATFLKDIGGVSGVSDSWFDPNYVAVDGGSGKVQSFIDYIDISHLLSQASAGFQVVAPTADAAFANALSALFVAASVTRYVSTRSAAAWGFVFNGTGVDLLHVFRTPRTGTQVVAACGGTNPILQHYFTAAGDATLQVTGLSANAAAAITANVGFYTEWSANANYAWRRKGTSAASGVFTPVVGDPNTTYTLGATGSFAFPADMNFRAMYSHRRVLNTSERTVHQQFIQSQTGVAP